MNTRSLRVRVAAWYFASVTAIFVLAAAGYWLAVRSALESALDQGLRYRLAGLRQYIDAMGPAERTDLGTSLRRLFRIGELYQVFDGDGRLLARSARLERGAGVPRPPQDLGQDIRFEWGGADGFPLRLAWQRVTVADRSLILLAVDPQRKYGGVLQAFTWVVVLSMPLVLALATGGGVWLGRRALAPVAGITQESRAITDQNLSVRLAVPRSGDELQLLSETLNAMLARIEDSFTRIRQFTADASHELRAPMTLIYTAAQFALRRERSREELEEGMRRIVRESERTITLIDDLLLLARGDAGVALTLDPTDAAPLLRELAERASAMGAAKNVEVRLRLGTDALPLRAHEPSLRRLLVILVDNAVKFTTRGGVIITGGRDGTHVTIAVADSGPGIAPNDQAKVFERFWRSDKVRGRDAGGTGLGLPIARQIAAWHKATLDLESVVDRGSTFTLRIPVA